MQYNKKSVEYITTDLNLITRKCAIYGQALLHARPRIRRALFKQKIALSKFYANISQAYASIYKPERGEHMNMCSYVHFSKLIKIFLNFFQKTIDKSLDLCYNKYTKKERYRTMIQKIKNFFNIKGNYKFEWNDFRCLLTVVNVLLIMTVGFQVAWFGLTIAILGFVKDMTDKKQRRINGTIMHLAMILLNGYFVYLNFIG